MFRSYRLMQRHTKEDWEAVPLDNPLAKQIRVAGRKIASTLRGTNPLAVIGGGSGIGKSHALDQAEKHTGIQALRVIPNDYRQLANALIQAKGRPLAFVECDHLFRSERSLNILKGAADVATGREFTLTLPPSKRSQPDQYVRAKAGPVIFLLNGNLLNNEAWPKIVLPHIQAICDREAPLFIDAEPEAWWEYSVYLALTHGLLRKTEDGKRDIPLRVQNTAIRWFTHNAWRQSHLSPRRLIKIAGKMMSDHDRRVAAKGGGPAYEPRDLIEDLDEFCLTDGKVIKSGPTPLAPEIFYIPKPKPNQAPALATHASATPDLEQGTQLIVEVVPNTEIKAASALLAATDNSTTVSMLDATAGTAAAEQELLRPEPRRSSKAELLEEFTKAKNLSPDIRNCTIIPPPTTYDFTRAGKLTWSKAAIAFFEGNFAGTVDIQLYDDTVFVMFDCLDNRDKFLDRFGGVKHPASKPIQRPAQTLRRTGSAERLHR